jgi:CBS domain-containing protein
VNARPQNVGAEAPASLPVSAPVAHVTFLYLSRVLDRPVRYEDAPKAFGSLHDIGAARTISYPQAVSIEVETTGAPMLTLPWSVVCSVSLVEVVIRRAAGPPPRPEFWARRDVLDDQVVDVSGARVLRVNDVHMIYSGGTLILAHAEVGLLGILRRLRFERFVCFLLRWLFDYTLQESFVTWRHIEVLSPGGIPGGVRVANLQDRLSSIHPAELADIMGDLGSEDRQALFAALSVEAAADTLEEVTPEYQRALVAQTEPERVADILEEMPSNEAANVLRDLNQSDAQSIMNRMESEAVADVRSILSHEEDSAGGAMATHCLEAECQESAGSVLQRVRRLAAEVDLFNHIYVLDPARHLTGVLTLRQLLRAEDGLTMADLMTKEPITVTPETRLREVARLLVKYGFRAIPVVDAEQVFLGAVRFRDVQAELARYLKD